MDTGKYPETGIYSESYLRVRTKRNLRRKRIPGYKAGALSFFIVFSLCIAGLAAVKFKADASFGEISEAGADIQPGYVLPDNVHPKQVYGQVPDSAAAAIIIPEVVFTTRIEKIPFSTLLIQTESGYEGYRKILTAGIDGAARVQYKSVTTGDDSSTEVCSAEIITEPVNEIIEIGVAQPGQPLGFYIWPVPEPLITSPFGRRDVEGASSNHEGIDLNGNRGDPIYASDGGIVTLAGITEGYGNTVIIEHSEGYKTLYAHCSELLVSEGDRVSQGDYIAKIGDSGNALGVHLHFELWLPGGKKVNPVPYLKIQT